MRVPNEVSIIRNKMQISFKSTTLLNLNHLQYMQIAENVLSKLPSSSSLIPDDSHRPTQQLRETRISTEECEDNAIKPEEGVDEKTFPEENEDLV